jgi:hypothetical protein
MYNDLMGEHWWTLSSSYNISKVRINFRYFSDETATFTVIQYPNFMYRNYFNNFENNI